MHTVDIFRSGVLALGIAWAPAALAQAAGCCTHQGGPVVCPPNLPAGSASVAFVPEGTRWVTPAGQQVFVPATTFSACTAPTPQASKPPAPAGTRPPSTPPVGSSPPVESVPPAPATPSRPVAAPEPPTAPPAAQAPTPGTASAPPAAPAGPPSAVEKPRASGLPRERVRVPPTVRVPESPPLLVVPSVPAEDGKEADAAIGRMGALLKAQEKGGVATTAGACPPPAGKGKGSNARVMRADAGCACEAPGVLKNEAPAPAGNPAPAGLNVEVHVNPNWRPIPRPVRANLGDDAGTISGVTRFGEISGADGGCTVIKGNCPGQCVTVTYSWVHLDFTADITYVRGLKNKAAHEAVHARQMASAIQAALAGLSPVPGFGCMAQAAAERLLDTCKRQLVREARTLTTRTMTNWQAERDAFQRSNRDYRSDPMEVEAFAEEAKGDGAGFPPNVPPPPEFAER